MKFGIEIEFYVPQRVSASMVTRSLSEAGIETYSEHYNHSTRSYWKVVTDGSLGLAGFNGLELVSPPMEDTAETFEQIRTACRVLGELNAVVRRSCGLHVHVDASRMTVDQVRNIFSRYGALENEIDAMMPASRRASNNTFCRSVAGVQLNRTTRIGDLMENRYYKVNLTSYVRHGTIEFRQHSGTVNAEKIINWVKFLKGFISASTTGPQAARRSSSAATNPYGFTARNIDQARSVVNYVISEAGYFNLRYASTDLNMPVGKIKEILEKIRTVGAPDSRNTLYRQQGWVSIRSSYLGAVQAAAEVLQGGDTSQAVPAPVALNTNVFAGVDQDVVSFYRERMEELSNAA